MTELLDYCVIVLETCTHKYGSYYSAALILGTPPHIAPWPLHCTAHATDKMFTCSPYCLPATLLTSKACSPLCLRRNGGTTAASLHCFAMVNYGCGLEHLPMPPDNIGGLMERGVSVL